MVVGERLGPMCSSQALRSSSTVSEPVLTLPLSTLATMAASSLSASRLPAPGRGSLASTVFRIWMGEPLARRPA